MHIQFDKEATHFEIGDIVKAIGKPQVLKIIECRAGTPHVHIVAEKTIHYRCEWRHPDGSTYTEWFGANKLEKIR